MRILVLGASGMLGSTIFRDFQSKSGFSTWGTIRSLSNMEDFSAQHHEKIISDIDVLEQDNLQHVFEFVLPDVVINCVGIIKQLASSSDPLQVLPVNSLLPHRLAKLCGLFGSRLIHMSTDCVFSGRKGFYQESDISDAEDLYGKSKFIGEVKDLSHVITLRTSMIGHENQSSNSLVDWFLSQTMPVKGFSKAIFSGLPTIELSRIIFEFIIPCKHLSGIYHVAADPINKYDLLSLIAEQYGKKISIIPDESILINRSLDASRFNNAVGYVPAKWPVLVEQMYQFYEKKVNN